MRELSKTMRLGLGFLIITGLGLSLNSTPSDDPQIFLTASDLYSGLEARKVVLDKDNSTLRLDQRAFEAGSERRGRVTTERD